jgi:hypothetical protein
MRWNHFASDRPEGKDFLRRNSESARDTELGGHGIIYSPS